MKILLITEKFSPEDREQRDGGSRLVETLQRTLGSSISTMQFGPSHSDEANWSFVYPDRSPDRFKRRLANAPFVAEQVMAVEEHFTHLFFVHISMQFGLARPLREDLEIWTFPMFLTPSYQAAGESVPQAYMEQERCVLRYTRNILTPSHLEKEQLVTIYGVSVEKICVVPRGVDRTKLPPKVRKLDGPPRLCSVGTIKRQKNTAELIGLFSRVRQKYTGATLQIVGPVQDPLYGEIVAGEIKRLGLEDAIDLKGYVSPEALSETLSESHLHLSCSRCETFGRSIFETLALGLPNVAFRANNAAAEFLAEAPYAQFVNTREEGINAVDSMLHQLSELSSMAVEIGDLYDDSFLADLMVSRICPTDSIGISDFDGTLYHKDSAPRTQKSIDAFKSYSRRILVSARRLDDLLVQLNDLDLAVDWIIALSGAVVADGEGRIFWTTPLNDGNQLQVEGSVADRFPIHLRREIYQGRSYLSNWKASKLRAVHRLLRTLGWTGRIYAFGDGPYDQEMLTYFDGTHQVKRGPYVQSYL